MNRSSLAGPMRIETVRGVSPLGAWIYSTWRPPHLGGLVDHVWAYSGPSTHRRKRVFPNGRVELLLNFGDPYRVVEGGDVELRWSAWIGGPQAGPMVVEQPPNQDVLGVRLRPAGARALVAHPMREVTGLSVDLADLVGPAAAGVVERCYEASSVAQRFRIVADWIGQCFLRAHDADAAIAWAVAQLDASGGTLPIAALRERMASRCSEGSRRSRARRSDSVSIATAASVVWRTCSGDVRVATPRAPRSGFGITASIASRSPRARIVAPRRAS